MTAATLPAPLLRYVKEDRLAWIIVDNPARMNALTAEMWRALPGRIAAAVEDPEVRVVILRGAGDKAFSAGADISEFESARSGDAARDYDALNEAAFQAITLCPKPVIAMIRGFCMGGGLGLALCADIRLADESSQFSIPVAKLGIGYNPRWVRAVLAAAPPACAKELVFTGRRFLAAEAEAIGLVNRLVPKADLEAATRALAAEIAANAPLSVAAAKLAIDEISRRPEQPNMAALDAAVARCMASEDYAEGCRAFLEKRKPEFKGR